MAIIEPTVAAEAENPSQPAAPKSGKVMVSMLLSPSGDSDKENWSPDEDGRAVSRRPAPSVPRAQNPRRTGRALQDQHGPGLLAGSRANTAPEPRNPRLVKGAGGIEIFEDPAAIRPAIADEEVQRFMRGEVSPSKKGDVDCVAGLLALSQGNWR